MTDDYPAKTKVEQLLALHNETCRDCARIMRKKNADYTGGDADPFSNFRIASIFGLHPVTGILLRVTDKLQRIRAFITNGVLAVDGESVDDACDDIVNYAILIKGMLQEERGVLHKREEKLDVCAEKDNDLEECTCGQYKVYNHIYGWICEDCWTDSYI